MLKKSSMTFAVCSMAPSCTKHCADRHKPSAINCGKKTFWNICKYCSEFTVFLRTTGPIKWWFFMETQMVTFSLWLLFFVKVLWRFHPQELHVLFVHSPVKMKIGLVWKPSVEKNLIFSFCSGCKLKSLFFVVVRNFVWEHFEIQSILCTMHWDIHHSQGAFLIDWLGLCFHFFSRPCSWSTQTLLFFHTPFFFKCFERT